jgi:hypothetical protein
VDWAVDFSAELHTVLVRKMKSILEGGEDYPYLSESCRERLGEIRNLARNSGILDSLVTRLSELRYAVFPWLGTRQLYTLHYLLLKNGIKSRLPGRTSVYLEAEFHAGADGAARLNEAFMRILDTETLDDLPLPDKIQIENKYNEYIPQSLLRKQFINDFLDLDGTKAALGSILRGRGRPNEKCAAAWGLDTPAVSAPDKGKIKGKGQCLRTRRKRALGGLYAQFSAVLAARYAQTRYCPLEQRLMGHGGRLRARPSFSLPEEYASALERTIKVHISSVGKSKDHLGDDHSDGGRRRRRAA